MRVSKQTHGNSAPQHAVKPLNSLGWDIVADKILHHLKKKTNQNH